VTATGLTEDCRRVPVEFAFWGRRGDVSCGWVGWEAGSRPPRYRRFQITDGVRVVVTTRSVLASSGSE
jgi:hypothetical protein